MLKKVDVTKEALTESLQKGVNIQELNQRCDEIVDLVLSKNADYGDAWQRYGIFTCLIRLNDKLLRVETLNGKAALIADETIQDTLVDIIGYSILALLLLRDGEQ